MKTIGIMGGTFDPIHTGHLIAAEQAREQTGLDEVWFMPTFAPPHKRETPGAVPEDRLAMVRRALEGHPRFTASDLEFHRGGTSFTIDTVEHLSKLYPDCSFHFIIGADMVEYLPHWHRIEDIASIVGFIGLARPGYREDVELPPFLEGRLKRVEMPQVDISSTQIRARCAAERSIRYLVPEQVRAYIEEKQLYVES